MVDPVQNLGDSFICSIEKVFLCTGADGYVPKYNPDKFEFGCLADASSLLYRFKIIVRIVGCPIKNPLRKPMIQTACHYHNPIKSYWSVYP